MSRESVIRQIVEREQAGQSLTEDGVLQESPDLHQAANELFGAWDTALQYAGVATNRPSAKQIYTAEHIVQRLQRICRQGCSIKASDIMRRQRRFYDAALRHFGTWHKVLEAAGVNLERAGLRTSKLRRPNRETVKQRLREWLAAEHPKTWAEICLQNRELALLVKRAFGSWRKAMLAIGLAAEQSPPVKPRKWTRDLVLEAIRQRRQEGKPMSYTAVYADASTLIGAAKKHFGNWSKALVAAGIEPEKHPRGQTGKKG